MEVKIITFGKITEIVSAKELRWQDIPDTKVLKEKLEEMYPLLKGMQYQIAVDKKIMHGETALSEDAEIALLPPYAGG